MLVWVQKPRTLIAVFCSNGQNNFEVEFSFYGHPYMMIRNIVYKKDKSLMRLIGVE